MQKVLVILGPTATGKTDLALYLAKKFNGELVSCDSRQVYKGLDIGTGKYPSKKEKVRRKKGYWEIGGFRVWMYDVVSPEVQYTVADYVKDANKVIAEIRKREKLPIIVGGTGLYLKALLYGLSNLSIPSDKRLRKKLEKLILSQLQRKLKKLSIAKWKNMNYSDRQNPRRLVRAIELLMVSPDRKRIKQLESRIKLFNVLKIGLIAPREILYKKVDKWVVSRIDQGMIGEARNLRENGLTSKRMKQLGLEYGVLADYLGGKIKNINILTKIMQNKIHGYIRRQLTYFKKEKEAYWFNIKENNFPAKVEKLVIKWYYPN